MRFITLRMSFAIFTIFKRLEHMDTAFKKYDDPVDEIEKQAQIIRQKIAFDKRQSWLVVTVTVG